MQFQSILKSAQGEDAGFVSAAFLVQIAVEQFRALSDSLAPTADERLWLDDISEFIAPGQSAGVFLAWARALQVVGTPLEYVRNASIERSTFSINGQEFPCTNLENGNYLLRQQLITAQQSYAFQRAPTEYPYALSLGESGCKLCENVALAIDRQGNSQPQSNILIDLGESCVLPNRYPQIPGHSLWMMKSHDDISTRVNVGTNISGPLVLPPQAGRTRGAICSVESLATVFALSDQLDLVATHNHVLDAMSIPAHDHWHLLPQHAIGSEQLEQLLGSTLERDLPLVTELENTPFSLLAVRGKDAAHTAAIAAPILASLERHNIVWTAAYAMNTAIISPRNPELVRDTRIGVGSGVSLHLLASSKNFINELAYVAARGSFPWDDMLKDPENAINNAEPSAATAYVPIPNQRDLENSSGLMVAPLLNDLERKIWNQCQSLQDQRHDKGHAETVTYLAYQLANIVGLSSEDREVVILSAILHDVGWSKIENISEVYQDLQADLRSSNQQIRSQASERNRELREQHQLFSVEIARTLLEDHTRLEEICQIIGDHDTRYSLISPTKVAVCMLDADVLWGITTLGIMSAKRQLAKLSSEWTVNDAAKWFEQGRNRLHLPVAIEIGEIELQRARDLLES